METLEQLRSKWLNKCRELHKVPNFIKSPSLADKSDTLQTNLPRLKNDYISSHPHGRLVSLTLPTYSKKPFHSERPDDSYIPIKITSRPHLTNSVPKLLITNIQKSSRNIGQIMDILFHKDDQVAELHANEDLVDGNPLWLPASKYYKFYLKHMSDKNLAVKSHNTEMTLQNKEIMSCYREKALNDVTQGRRFALKNIIIHNYSIMHNQTGIYPNFVSDAYVFSDLEEPCMNVLKWYAITRRSFKLADKQLTHHIINKLQRYVFEFNRLANQQYTDDYDRHDYYIRETEQKDKRLKKNTENKGEIYPWLK